MRGGAGNLVSAQRRRTLPANRKAKGAVPVQQVSAVLNRFDSTRLRAASGSVFGGQLTVHRDVQVTVHRDVQVTVHRDKFL
jgi:hypothetical protein